MLALDDTAKIAHLGRGDVAGLDREDDLLGLVAEAFVEVDPAVDPLVRALLPFGRPGTDQAERPPLELIGIILRQLRRVGQGDRLAGNPPRIHLRNGELCASGNREARRPCSRNAAFIKLACSWREAVLRVNFAVIPREDRFIA